MSSAATIARALRGRQCSGAYLCRCPVPSHGKGRGDRGPSLLVKDGDKAPLVKCFAGCEPRSVLDELRARGLLDSLDVPNRARRDRDRTAFVDRASVHSVDGEARDLWFQGGPIADTAVARFLASRGLTLEPPPTLRATTSLYGGRYPYPAMLAAVQAPDRRIVAVQRTLIDPLGHEKAGVALPRRTIGALGYGAVRLGAAGDVLGLAEGTEKALAAMQLFGVPCWSSLGAGRMHRVWIPETVQELHIFSDNDKPGEQAAHRVAELNRHRRVVIHFPPDQYKDWDDVTSAQAAERRAS